MDFEISTTQHLYDLHLQEQRDKINNSYHNLLHYSIHLSVPLMTMMMELMLLFLLHLLLLLPPSSLLLRRLMTRHSHHSIHPYSMSQLTQQFHTSLVSHPLPFCCCYHCQ
ncbi:unnamed protein product [Schistosoma curassoni]|uniref:Ovule protein n=1 Tax=Schistosoma curassoni TaxID=6186 RepID=A0A183JS15_9TREM|nr:unnamed protein product [Schistosoma curassoni]